MYSSIHAHLQNYLILGFCFKVYISFPLCASHSFHVTLLALEDRLWNREGETGPAVLKMCAGSFILAQVQKNTSKANCMKESEAFTSFRRLFVGLLKASLAADSQSKDK